MTLNFTLLLNVKLNTEKLFTGCSCYGCTNLAAKCREHRGQCCQGNVATCLKAALLHVSNAKALKASFPLHFPTSTTTSLGYAIDSGDLKDTLLLKA